MKNFAKPWPKEIKNYLQRHKYIVLFGALIQHLFIGVFLNDMDFYRDVIWPINILILGIASIGVFAYESTWKLAVKNSLLLMALLFPLAIPLFGHVESFFILLNVVYVLFFSFIFLEVMRFLIKPGYINADLLSACACGYLLLVEISVFLFSFFVYLEPGSFHGIDIQGNAQIFMDLVYFSVVNISSIGFGDIVPKSHHTKLVAAFFGINGQFYAVILVGILISKFSNYHFDGDDLVPED